MRGVEISSTDRRKITKPILMPAKVTKSKRLYFYHNLRNNNYVFIDVDGLTWKPNLTKHGYTGCS